MFLISGLVVSLIIIDYRAQQQALGKLQGQLESARGQLKTLDASSTRIASQYREVMQKQFNEWQLTTSEQDVVLGLLKGLSVREAAETQRHPRENRSSTSGKRVSKAGAAGRHELTTWFFEDKLDSSLSVKANSVQ